jgi:predicted nucleic acid-binding protein
VIIADTSVWVDHLRGGGGKLERALVAGSILIHPFVIGEISLGHLRQRKRILEDLRALPMAAVAADDEVLGLIDQAKLFGRGVGYIDAHLLAATRLSGNSALWTYDRPLLEAAQYLGLAYDER